MLNNVTKAILRTQYYFSNVYNIINKKLSAKVFPSGMESVKAFHNEAMTFFSNKNFKALSLQMLQKRTRDDLMSFADEVLGHVSETFNGPIG